MQRTIGNRAVQGAVRPLVLHPKLTINTHNDVYDKEVDQVDEEENSPSKSALLLGGSSGANDGGSQNNGAKKTTIRHVVIGTGLPRLPLASLQRSIGNQALARLLHQTIPVPAGPEVRRKCACGGDSEGECAECRANRAWRLPRAEDGLIQRDSDTPDQADQPPASAPSADGTADDSTLVSMATITVAGQPQDVHVEGGCDGLTPHGKTDASFDGGKGSVANQKVTKADGCNCDKAVPCVHVTGTLVTNYKVTVKITMPPMPSGLTVCERGKVQNFLDRVLRPHELDHKTRFETYNGQTKNPVDVTGCGQADVTKQVQAIQDTEEAQRQSAAQALSDAIDPFNQPIDCSDCQKQSAIPGSGGDSGIAAKLLSRAGATNFPVVARQIAPVIPVAPTPVPVGAPPSPVPAPAAGGPVAGGPAMMPAPAGPTSTPKLSGRQGSAPAAAMGPGSAAPGVPGPTAAAPAGAEPQPTGAPSTTASAGAKGAPPALPAREVDTGSSEAILESLAASPASAFPGALESAKGSTAAAQAREQADLEKSYPEIERPTGMPPGLRPSKAAPAALSKGAAPGVKAPSGGGPAAVPPPKTEVATEPVPGASAPISGAEPATTDGDSGSWWDWLTSRLRSLVASLPTTDPGLSTSAGPRPKTDLSGEADPAQNEAIAASGREQVDARRAQADAATARQFGESDIAPTVAGGKLRPRASRGGSPGAAKAGAKASPVLPNDMRAQLDAARSASIKAGVDPQIAQHRQQQALFDQKSQQARDDGQRKITAENERARGEQTALKQQARQDVDGERERWRAENRKVLQNYSDGSQAKRAETEKQIDDKVKTTNQSVDDNLTQAETKADQERAKAEQQAAQKRAEVENKPHSFWDSIKGAVSSFFNEVKSAITGIFEGLRAAVKAIIDEAKAVVHDLVQAARQFVIGLIKAFADIVKAAISVALAAFPELAEKAREWIDRRVADAVDAVNRVADALEKTINAILDAVGAVLDAALRTLQAGFLAILNTLEGLANAVLQVMEWMAKLAELLKKFGAFLKGLEQLVATGVEKLLNEAKKTLQQYIDQIPGKVESTVQQHAKDFGKGAEKHIQGIWRHLKPALAHLKDHWWDEVKQMVWNLVWPFNEKSPIWKDVPEMIKLPGKILDSLKEGKTSQATDQYLELWQKINSVLGVFYGWFFIASVLVGAIIGAFFGGAGAIPGAVAGAEFAGTVGEGLLIAMVATETGVIAKAAYDLAFGPGTTQVNESAYDRIANSSLTLGITGAMMVLGELAADLAKAIIDGVKGIFKGEAPKVEVPKGEEPKPELPTEADIAAKEPTADGHEIEVTKDGEVLLCSSCDLLRKQFRDILDDPDPQYDPLRQELDAADQVTDPKAKATAEAAVEQKLAAAKAAKLRELGTDPGGKFRQGEADAADRLQQRVGRLRRDPSGDGDWIDVNGRVYDAVGPVPDSKFFDAASFDSQIDKHLLKQGVDEIVVDVANLTPAQKAQVQAHINGLSPADQARISIQGR